MSEQIRIVQHYSLNMDDSVGAGARILDAMRDADVNFIAIWGYAMGPGSAKLELVPDDDAGFSAAAKATGITPGEPSTAFYVVGSDRRGAIADALDRLAKANVSVEALQAVSESSGRFGAVVYVAASDVQAAGTALGAQS